ncbi:hypothetical protein LLB_0327 [Legionella longbeachae D-4968]|nr:hypothetical protein LLB_0327 [Legionella longbeachae D-4968]
MGHFMKRLDLIWQYSIKTRHQITSTRHLSSPHFLVRFI